MHKISLIGLLIMLLINPVRAQAHMSVENRFYEDIELSKAREQIVLLRALHVISPDSGAWVGMKNNSTAGQSRPLVLPIIGTVVLFMLILQICIKRKKRHSA
jgi:hypothetical protein